MCKNVALSKFQTNIVKVERKDTKSIKTNLMKYGEHDYIYNKHK